MVDDRSKAHFRSLRRASKEGLPVSVHHDEGQSGAVPVRRPGGRRTQLPIGRRMDGARWKRKRRFIPVGAVPAFGGKPGDLLFEQAAHPERGSLPEKPPSAVIGIDPLQAMGQPVQPCLINMTEILKEPLVETPLHDEKHGEERQAGGTENREKEPVGDTDFHHRA